MKVAYLLHFYPPSPCGGAGYFTANLVEALHKVNVDVAVLCVDKWGEGDHYLNGQIDEIRNGIPIRRLLVNWKKAPRPFDWLYDSPVLGEQAHNFLSQFQPDVVHVGSCYTLSARPVYIAQELGLPIVMHLHDYWTICARLTLLHKNNTICTGPDSAWKCQQCLLAGTKFWKLSSLMMQGSIRKLLLEEMAKYNWITRLPSLHGMLGDMQKRFRYVLGACKKADILVTPTAFARDLLEAHGIEKGRIRVIPNGNNLEWVNGLRRNPSHPIRIGFLGNVIPTKGVHILIDAYKLLLQDYSQINLEIWGDFGSKPEYYLALRSMATDDIKFGGRYESDDLPSILANLDVVVVPSIWYETHGIVIQEAFAAGLPVIVSAGTSLTESVTDEVNGLHFQMGSATDLANKLRRLIEEPGLLDKLSANIPSVRTIEEDAKEYSRLYFELVHSTHV